MSAGVSDSENERASQYDEPPPEKRITFDSEARKNIAGPSKIPAACAMRIPCITQSSSDLNQTLTDGKERRKERQRRYRERNREVIRERNRNYYSQRRKNAQPTASGSGLNDIEAMSDDEDSNKQKPDNRKKLQNERNRRYREKKRETIKQRNKDYRQRQINVQQESEAPNPDADAVPNSDGDEACSVYDRLWFEEDLKKASPARDNLIQKITLEKDVANYSYYKAMGAGHMYTKPSAVPHKFDCQPSWRRTQSQSTGTLSAREQRLGESPAVPKPEPSIPSISTGISPEASTSWVPFVVKVEPPECVVSDWETAFSVKNEEFSEEPLINVSKRCTTADVGVQVDIRPEYRSISTYCGLDLEKTKCDSAA